MALLSSQLTLGRIDLIDVAQSFRVKDGKDDSFVELFNGITLSVIQGHSYAITGPSGAGKSSLLMLMAGLESPEKGRVSKVARNDIGFIFQQFHLLPELNALHNVALPLKLRGVKDAEPRASRWLENVGLTHRANHKPSQLSGGEQQRVAIARALVFEPKFIFADEPTGNLDAKTADVIADLLFDCCKQSGAGLVVVTHSQMLAERADTAFNLNAGVLEHVQ